MYICHKMSGCVRECEVGARRVRLWPFWHHFAPFWQANGASSDLLQSCHFPEHKLLLHDDSMLRSWIRGRRSGRCVPWVILLRPDVGADTGNAINPQPLHSFKLDQAWGLWAIKDIQKFWNGANRGCGWKAVGQNVS